jgi:hypothetical protein
MSKNEILEKIKKGKVKMKPRSYFILRTIVFVLGLIFAFLFAIFLASFIVFTLRASGAWYFPAFGFRGLGLFLTSFPWVLLIFAILLIAVLEIFARKFSLVYRKPLLYSILGIVVIIVLIGFAVGQTSMHSQLFRSVQEGKLPIMGLMYKGNLMEPSHNACIGEVVEVTDSGFQVETVKGESVGVIVSSETYLPSDEKIEEGELIMIMGERENSIIKAFKVIKIKKGKEIYLHKGGNIRSYRKMK